MAARTIRPQPQPKSNDKDSPLSNANHSRGFDPSKSSQGARMSDKLNGDSGQYRGDSGKQAGSQAGPKLNEDANRMRSEK